MKTPLFDSAVRSHWKSCCAAVLLGLAPFCAFAEAPAVSARELVELRDLGSVAPSPDGQVIAVRVHRGNIERNRIELAWYVIPVGPGGAPRRVADAGDATYSANGTIESSGLDETPLWSADSRWFYYRALYGSEVQVWRTARDGSRTERLTTDGADVLHVGLEGDSLWFGVKATRAEIIAAEQLEYDSGTRLTDAVKTLQPIARSREINGRMAPLRDTGNLVHPLLWDHPESFKVLNLADRTVRPATSSEASRFAEVSAAREASSFFLQEFPPSPSGTKVIATSPLPEPPSGRRSVLKYRVLAWKGTAPGSVEKVCRDPAGAGTGRLRVMGWLDDNTALFTNRNHEGQGIYAWDLKRDRVRRVFFTEGDGTLGLDGHGRGVCPLIGGEFIGVLSQPGVPPRLVAISLETGKARTLFDPNPHLTPERLGIAEHLVITDGVGNKTSANLILPRNRKPGERLPLVITDYSVHGFLQGGGGKDVPEQLLAAAGIATASIIDSVETEYSPEMTARYGGDLRHIPQGMRARGEASVSLRLALVEMLAQRGLVDPGRVALTGMSGGADQVLHVISQTKAFRAAIITTTGSNDPIIRFLISASDRMHERNPQGKLQFGPDFYQVMSPAGRADQIETPLLMLEPDSEFLGTMQLFCELRERGKAVETVIYPDEYHIKMQPRHRLNVSERGVAWLRFWLQGWEDSNATDKGQYERWRKMKAAAAKSTTKAK